MMGDAGIAGDAYPVDAPGLALLEFIQFKPACFLDLSFLWTEDLLD